MYNELPQRHDGIMRDGKYGILSRKWHCLFGLVQVRRVLRTVVTLIDEMDSFILRLSTSKVKTLAILLRINYLSGLVSPENTTKTRMQPLDTLGPLPKRSGTSPCAAPRFDIFYLSSSF